MRSTRFSFIYANLYFPNAMSEIILFQAQSSPFKGYLFSDDALKNISALIWWKALIKQNKISKDLAYLVEQLFTSICRSAGIERLFQLLVMSIQKLETSLEWKKLQNWLLFLNI